MTEQGKDAGDDFIEEIRWQFANGGGAAGSPVEGADLVGESDALDGEAGRQWGLEGVAFYLAGDGAAEREAGLGVVGGGAEDEGGAVARLLVAGLWIKVEPHGIAALGGLGRRLGGHGYQTSFPQGLPQLVSGWVFLAVMRFSRSFSR